MTQSFSIDKSGAAVIDPPIDLPSEVQVDFSEMEFEPPQSPMSPTMAAPGLETHSRTPHETSVSTEAVDQSPEVVTITLLPSPTALSASFSTSFPTPPPTPSPSPPDKSEVSRANRLDKFLEHLHEVRDHIHRQREIVAQESVEALRLKEEAKAARDSLKASTESLSGLELQLSELERLWESGEWVQWEIPNREKTDGRGSDGSEAARQSGSVTSDSHPAASGNPATTSPLSSLGITPGRLESIEQQTDCRTVAGLEKLIRDGKLQQLKGFGPAAVDAVVDRIRIWREKNPIPESAVPKVPLIDGEWDQAQYHAGQIACADGKPFTANPHPAPSHAFSSWFAGWDAKSREHIKNCAAKLIKSVEPVSEAKEVPKASTKRRGHKVQPISKAKPLKSESGEVDGAVVAAYQAGCEAAIENKPVHSNPHLRGTESWGAWDRGWQETFVWDDADSVGEELNGRSADGNSDVIDEELE